MRYALTGGNREILFSIGQQSGVITLAASLDYEAEKEVKKEGVELKVAVVKKKTGGGGGGSGGGGGGSS